MADDPRRRLHLDLTLEADALDLLVRELRQIADDLELAGVETGKQTSGAWSCGHHLTLTCDPDQDGDRYRAQLKAWAAQRRTAPNPTEETT